MMNELKRYANDTESESDKPGHAFISIYYSEDYLKSKQSATSIINFQRTKQLLLSGPSATMNSWIDKVASIHEWHKDKRGLNVFFLSLLCCLITCQNLSVLSRGRGGILRAG